MNPKRQVLDDDTFVYICPHCDEVVKRTIEQIMSGEHEFRTIDMSAGIHEWRCPHCNQWCCLDDLDTMSMIEDGKITSNVDYERIDP